MDRIKRKQYMFIALLILFIIIVSSVIVLAQKYGIDGLEIIDFYTQVTSGCDVGVCSGNETTENCFIDCKTGNNCMDCGSICQINTSVNEFAVNASMMILQSGLRSSTIQSQVADSKYIIELSDEPVLKRKAKLEKRLRKQKRELRKLKKELTRSVHLKIYNIFSQF